MDGRKNIPLSVSLHVAVRCVSLLSTFWSIQLYSMSDIWFLSIAFLFLLPGPHFFFRCSHSIRPWLMFWTPSACVYVLQGSAAFPFRSTQDPSFPPFLSLSRIKAPRSSSFNISVHWSLPLRILVKLLKEVNFSSPLSFQTFLLVNPCYVYRPAPGIGILFFFPREF